MIILSAIKSVSTSGRMIWKRIFENIKFYLGVSHVKIEGNGVPNRERESNKYKGPKTEERKRERKKERKKERKGGSYLKNKRPVRLEFSGKGAET